VEAVFVDQGYIGENVPIGCGLNARLFVPGMTLQKSFHTTVRIGVFKR
jgi:hypothetical protein